MSEAGLPRVLCVDDEPNILRALTRSLHGHFDVDTAVGGEAGLDALAAGGYRLVMSDMRMPGMDGLQFLAEVARRWPQTVRVLLTGMGDSADSEAALKSGVLHRVLAKPCPVDELRAALAALVAP
jgi:DNA-binding NtrC family response regulator